MHIKLEAPSASGGKFWEVWLDGQTYHTRFGKKGSAGQVRSKSFDTQGAAKVAALAQMESKLKKGYETVLDIDSSRENTPDPDYVPPSIDDCKKPPTKRRKVSRKKATASAEESKTELDDDNDDETRTRGRRRKKPVQTEDGKRLSTDEALHKTLSLSDCGKAQVFATNTDTGKFVVVCMSPPTGCYHAMSGALCGKWRTAHREFDSQQKAIDAAIRYLRTKLVKEGFEMLKEAAFKKKVKSDSRLLKRLAEYSTAKDEEDDNDGEEECAAESESFSGQRKSKRLKAKKGKVKYAEESGSDVEEKEESASSHRSHSGIFEGCTICLSGALSETQAAAKSLFESYGFTVSLSMAQSVEYLVIGDYALPRSAKCKTANKRGIPIVRECWIHDSHKENKRLPVDEYLAESESRGKSGGGDSKSKSTTVSSSKSSLAAASRMKIVRLKKGQAPVDDHFYAAKRGLSPEKLSIYVSADGKIWDATLNQTNIANNNNKYYKLQLIVTDSLQYYTWFRWGRVGYVNGTTVKPCQGDAMKAMKLFEDKFRAKTLNDWRDDEYTPYAGKYVYLPMDYSADTSEDEEDADGDDGSKTKMPVVESTLSPALQKLLALIFDKNMMEEEMREIGFDASRLPLGRLKKSTIEEAYEILGRISQLLGLRKSPSVCDSVSVKLDAEEDNDGGDDEEEAEVSDDSAENGDGDDDNDDESWNPEDDDYSSKRRGKAKRAAKKGKGKGKSKKGKVTGVRRSTRRVEAMKSATYRKKASTSVSKLSNEYYTLIPHDFGFRVPPPLRSEQLLSRELELIEALGNIEICTRLVKSERADHSGVAVVDKHYAQLKAVLRPLETDSKMHKVLSEYVRLGHGPTHLEYTASVRNVFEVQRNGCDERFAPFAAEKNRMLLWHGTSLCNFVGIVKDGLRIKPKGVAHVGSMFGNGIYFADVLTKSANYCRASKSNPTAIVLLAEVAMGKMEDKQFASASRKRGMHSVRGVGAYTPDPKKNVTLDSGCVVPVGDCVLSDPSLSDMDQVSADGRLRYNEFIVYDSNRVRIRYLVQLDLKYELSEW